MSVVIFHYKNISSRGSSSSSSAIAKHRNKNAPPSVGKRDTKNGVPKRQQHTKQSNCRAVQRDKKVQFQTINNRRRRCRVATTKTWPQTKQNKNKQTNKQASGVKNQSRAREEGKKSGRRVVVGNQQQRTNHGPLLILKQNQQLKEHPKNCAVLC